MGWKCITHLLRANVIPLRARGLWEAAPRSERPEEGKGRVARRGRLRMPVSGGDGGGQKWAKLSYAAWLAGRAGPGWAAFCLASEFQLRGPAAARTCGSGQATFDGRLSLRKPGALTK